MADCYDCGKILWTVREDQHGACTKCQRVQAAVAPLRSEIALLRSELAAAKASG